MIVPEKDSERYAELLLHLVSVGKGDLLLISTQLGYAEIAQTLYRKAYQRGAKYVGIFLRDNTLDLIRAKHSDPQYLEYQPSSITSTLQEYIDSRACVISLRSPAASDMSKQVPAKALAAINNAYMARINNFHDAVISDQFSWIVAAYPTLEWGQSIFPSLPAKEAGKKLWEHMRTILMLDREDLIAAWEERKNLIQKRKNYLDRKKYHALHFVAENTDWFVSLNKRSVWSGAAHTSANNKRFQANVPTEETYTTPDCRYSHGKVQAQRPIDIYGKIVNKVTMHFEQGRVSTAHAEQGNDVLQQFLNSNERNRYLGEIALVDTRSLVWKSGLVFNNILYDENAGVHFALGSGYATGYGFDFNTTLEKEDLIAMGCNASNDHYDFTIGYEGMSVYGVYYMDSATEDIAQKKILKEEIIIEKGLFAINEEG